MDTRAVISGAQRMAAAAKDGTLKLADGTYTFTFDRATWVYIVRDPQGVELHRYNTKSLKQARQWLREYFSN